MSCGSRARNRIAPSGAARAPATIARPRTSSPFANREPRIDVRATTSSPADSANNTMKSSGRFPSVDWSAPVTAGPKRSPTDSVAIEIAHARPPSAAPATMNTTTGSTSAKWRIPVRTASARIAPRISAFRRTGRLFRARPCRKRARSGGVDEAASALLTSAGRENDPVRCADLADRLRGHARGDDAGGQVAGHDRACADHGVVADGHAGADDRRRRRATRCRRRRSARRTPSRCAWARGRSGASRSGTARASRSGRRRRPSPARRRA